MPYDIIQYWLVDNVMRDLRKAFGENGFRIREIPGGIEEYEDLEQKVREHVKRIAEDFSEVCMRLERYKVDIRNH